VPPRSSSAVYGST